MRRELTVRSPAFFRLRSLLALTLAAFGAAQACTESRDTEPYVPARGGAFQPDGGGALIAEAEACERVAQAEDDARAALGCAPAQRADCPEYVRPPGAAACYRYDEATVDGCVAFYDSLLTCDELTTRRCIVAAVHDDSLPGCAQGQGQSPRGSPGGEQG